MKRILYSALFLLMFSSKLNAGISIEPFRFEIQAPAGETFSQKFKITNKADTSTKVIITVVDRTVNPLKKDWIVFPKKEIPIKPHQTGDLNFTVSLPKDAQGQYNAKVVFEEKPESGNVLGFNMRYNLPIYVTVTGTEKYSFEIKDFEIINLQRTNLKIFVFNSGNVHIRPTGTIKITSADKKYELVFNKGKFVNLPQEGKYYDNYISDENVVLPAGKYKADISVEAGGKTQTKQIEFEIKETKPKKDIKPQKKSAKKKSKKAKP